jgi:hypothetical protein
MSSALACGWAMGLDVSRIKIRVMFSARNRFCHQAVLRQGVLSAASGSGGRQILGQRDGFAKAVARNCTPRRCAQDVECGFAN